MNTGKAGSTNPGAVNATSEQAVEEPTTVLCASDIETDNTKAIYTANLEIPLEVNTEVEADKAVLHATAEYLHTYLPATVKNESLGNAESSEDTTIICEIVGDLTVYVSPTFSRSLTVHGAEVLTDDSEYYSKHSSTFASAVDYVGEQESAFTVNAELKGGESEKVLPCDSDGGMTSASSVAADAGTEETEFMSGLTDDVPQLQDTFGTDVDDLMIMRSDAQIPMIREADNVVVLYDVEDHNDHPTKVPDPYPCSLNKHSIHVWDRNYARMPYAVDNWQKITMVLKQLTDPIQSWEAVEDAIKQYCKYPAAAIDFGGLGDYFYKKDLDDTLLSRTCLLDLIPKIAKLAVDLPDICTRPIRLLRQQKNFMVAMSQYQAACLLANAFFCTYPTASGKFADVNFMGLFRQSRTGRCASQHAKLDCIFNYFRRVTTNPPTGIITFRRQVG